MKLSDAERRALVLLREMGAMTNQDYRQVNGVDTLVASRALTHLRDSGLLTMKGSENRTYYTLSDFAVTPPPDISSLNEGFPENFPRMSEKLIDDLKSLEKRSSSEKIRVLIKALCTLKALQLVHLSKIFNRAPRYLRDKFLTKMIQ